MTYRANVVVPSVCVDRENMWVGDEISAYRSGRKTDGVSVWEVRRWDMLSESIVRKRMKGLGSEG